MRRRTIIPTGKQHPSLIDLQWVNDRLENIVAQKTILETWGVSAEYLTDLVNSNPSLRGMIVGYIAERKLHEMFDDHGRTDSHRKDDDHDRTKKGDLCVTYNGHELRIEVKSLQTNTIEIKSPDGQWIKMMSKNIVGRKPSEGFTKTGKPRKGKPIYKWELNPAYLSLSEEYKENAEYRGSFQCDASDRRDVFLSNGQKVNTTLLKIGEFDIVAAGIFGFRGKWEFGFALNEDLPRSTHSSYSEEVQEQLIASLIPITWPLKEPFVSDPFTLLDRVVERKRLMKTSSSSSEKSENMSDFFEREPASSTD